MAGILTRRCDPERFWHTWDPRGIGGPHERAWESIGHGAETEVVEVAWERRGGGFLRRGGGASEGGAEGAGASATTRRRDRANPVCDWQGAGGGGRSSNASQGQTEVRMTWAGAMPRPEQRGVLRPRAGGGDDDGARDAERPSEDGGA